MITEDYCGFETARLLKEKGFDVATNTSYVIDNHQRPFVKVGDFLYNRPTEPHLIAAPSLALAMKWLRETYDIHVVTRKYFFNGTYTGMIYDGRRENVFDKDDYIALVGCETYEEACESAIKHCLENLI